MIEFSGEEIEDPKLGIIWQPYADVTIQNGNVRLECGMLVDSGADLTLIPYQVGLYLGFEMRQEEVDEMRGIGDTVVPYVLREATLQMDSHELGIRLGWALIEEVPIVMGRLDVFDHFRVEFDQLERAVRFVPQQ